MAELALVSEFFSAQVLQEPSVHSHPARHGTSGGIRLGAACCCGGGRRGRWCAVFAFKAACPSTRCHQSLAALARPFSLSPSPFPILNKPSRVPAFGCIGWHSERKKIHKNRQATFVAAACPLTVRSLPPSVPCTLRPKFGRKRGGGWKGGKSIVLRHTNQKRSGSGEGGRWRFQNPTSPPDASRAVDKVAVGREVHDPAD